MLILSSDNIRKTERLRALLGQSMNFTNILDELINQLSIHYNLFTRTYKSKNIKTINDHRR